MNRQRFSLGRSVIPILERKLIDNSIERLAILEDSTCSALYTDYALGVS